MTLVVLDVAVFGGQSGREHEGVEKRKVREEKGSCQQENERGVQCASSMRGGVEQYSDDDSL